MNILYCSSESHTRYGRPNHLYVPGNGLMLIIQCVVTAHYVFFIKRYAQNSWYRICRHEFHKKIYWSWSLQQFSNTSI